MTECNRSVEEGLSGGDLAGALMGWVLWSVQGSVVWEGTVEEFDSSEEPIVRQFASGSLDGPIQYE